VFTHTIPALFAGGVCCCVGVAVFVVEADFVEPDEEADDEAEGAGVWAGAGGGAGAAAGVEAGFEFAVLEAAGVEDPEAALPEAGCVVSAASDFFERFFFVVVVPESAVVEDPDAVDGDVGDPVEVPADAPEVGC
jgi:hypothetical protein